MPAQYYRLEVRIPNHIKSHLERLRKEAIEKTGKFISMSSLVATILEESSSRFPVEQIDSEKSRLFLLLSSS